MGWIRNTNLTKRKKEEGDAYDLCINIKKVKLHKSTKLEKEKNEK